MSDFKGRIISNSPIGFIFEEWLRSEAIINGCTENDIMRVVVKNYEEGIGDETNLGYWVPDLEE